MTEILQVPLELNHPYYDFLKPILDKFPFCIAGGAARQAFLNDNAFGSTDIDLYLVGSYGFYTHKKVLERALNVSPINRENSYANTYALPNGCKLQLVKGAYADIKSIFNTFDFTCCEFAIKDSIIYYTKEAEEHTLSKELYCREDGASIAKIYRIVKYVMLKGYFPTCKYTKYAFQNIITKYNKDELNSLLEAAKGNCKFSMLGSDYDHDAYAKAYPQEDIMWI